MIKRCPSCNRTYSDESISFCLADGALLSAPYDSLPTEAPPTAVLNSPPVEVAPTQPARSAASTMTSLPVAHKHEAVPGNPAREKRSPGLWFAVTLGVLAIIVLAAVAVRFFLKRNDETIVTMPAQASPAQAQTEGSPARATTNPTATPLAVLTKPTPQPTTEGRLVSAPAKSPAENSQQTRLDPDPALFPPNARSSRPAASPNYERIFGASEVDQRAKIISQPNPTYTDEARKNQISGTVVLRVVFSATGEVTHIHAVSVLPDGLTEQAIAAAKQVKFVPATKDGRAVSMWTELQYNFSLY